MQLGDVDGDGKIASADATAVANYLFVHAPLPHPEAADVDCDGAITEADANCISDFALGKFVAFRCDFSFGYGAPGAGGAGGTGAPCGLVSGDADGDGVVETTDEFRIEAFDTGQPVLPIYWIAADVNCDGSINSVDAMFIAQSLNGTRELLPCGAGGAGAGGAGGTGGAPPVGLLGDVNGDGVVDLSDADAVACHAGSCGSDLVHPEAADVNCDGAIDLWDARRIAKYAQCALDHLDCEAR